MKRLTDMNRLGKLVVDIATGQQPKDYPDRKPEKSDLKTLRSCARKVLHHAYSVALHYNFLRPHALLGGLTPAQAASVTDRPYTLNWFVDRVEQTLSKPKRPTQYKSHT